MRIENNSWTGKWDVINRKGKAVHSTDSYEEAVRMHSKMRKEDPEEDMAATKHDMNTMKEKKDKLDASYMRAMEMTSKKRMMK